MTYQSKLHANRCKYFRQNANPKFIENIQKYEGACYILTAFDEIWERVKDGVSDIGIDFKEIVLSGCGIISYTFIKCADDIIHDGNYISIYDIQSTEELSLEHRKVLLEGIRIAGLPLPTKPNKSKKPMKRIGTK